MNLGPEKQNKSTSLVYNQANFIPGITHGSLSSAGSEPWVQSQ